MKRVSLVWWLLVLATCVSWIVGTHEGGNPGDVHPAGFVILVIALTKVRFVGRYFMELRHAPTALRIVFEVWALGTAVGLGTVYALA